VAKLWRVVAESHRTCTFYVAGDSFTEIKVDAKELVHETHPDEWDEDDLNVEVFSVDEIAPGNHLWRGGPEGSWTIT
jgi:hypothetical protein